MELHFDQELARVKDLLLRMSGLTEERVAEALKSLTARDSVLAARADAADTELDRLQMEIDERVIELIALRQPKARDLRFLVMTMKIAAELERIGDQAVNIAIRAIALNKEPLLKPLIDIPRMADHACGMIRDALDAFVHAKPELAHEVVTRDERVDLLYDQLSRELTSFMIEDPHTITRALNLIAVAQNLERIADHATNIAEEVVYLLEARDIRHQHPGAQAGTMQ